MSCELIESRGEAFLDGELPANQMLELQGHVDRCPDCRVQLSFSSAIRETTRRVVLHQPGVDSAFEERMLQTLRDETEREAASSLTAVSLASVPVASVPDTSVPDTAGRGMTGNTSDRGANRWVVLGPFWTRAIPIAAAAAAAIFFLGTEPSEKIQQSGNPQQSPASTAFAKAGVAKAAATQSPIVRAPILRPVMAKTAVTQSPIVQAPILRPVVARAMPARPMPAQAMPARPMPAPTTDDLLDRLIEIHAAPPADQVTQSAQVNRLARDVGVLVDFPRIMEKEYGAHFQGGSVVRMRNNQLAAQLRYHTPDNRHFTVYIYDPKRLPLHAGLNPSRLYAEPVYLGRHRGYSIAASTQYGVGYAVAGDLNPKQSAQLIRTIAYGKH